MSHIAVDLKVVEVRAPAVARALGLDTATVIGALVILWHRCWSLKTDRVSALEVRGFFPQPDAAEVLASFGLLEAVDGGYRVKGADRYLRIAEQRRAAGLARSSAAGRSAGRFTSEPPAEDQRTNQRATSGGPALTPSTEHRTPTTSSEDVGADKSQARGVKEWVAPKTDPLTWNGIDFFAWFQASRQELGLIGEKFPKAPLGPWLNEVLMTPGMTIHRLMDAVPAYGRSEHWRTRTPPLPWAGFASEWRRFVPALGEAA